MQSESFSMEEHESRPLTIELMEECFEEALVVEQRALQSRIPWCDWMEALGGVPVEKQDPSQLASDSNPA